jgi:hypothetical protein
MRGLFEEWPLARGFTKANGNKRFSEFFRRAETDYEAGDREWPEARGGNPAKADGATRLQWGMAGQFTEVELAGAAVLIGMIPKSLDQRFSRTQSAHNAASHHIPQP